MERDPAVADMLDRQAITDVLYRYASSIDHKDYDTLRSVLAAGRPVILYCHPYEFSPEEMDEFRGKVGLSVRVTQGIGRSSFIRRVHGLLANLPFGRFAEVMSGWRS